MAKLTGLKEAFGAGVQSLGRESVSGPVRVATAQAAVAQKKAQVAGQVAGNVAAIGNTRQRMGNQLVASQGRQISRDQEFASGLRRLAGQGADLAVTIIKSDAAKSLRDYENGESEDMLALSEAPGSFEQPLDPNKPSLGTRSVSTHNDLMPQFNKMQLERKEAILSNTTPMARPMVEELINRQQAASTLKMKDMVIARAKDFTAGEIREGIADAVRDENWTMATRMVKEGSNVFTGREKAALLGTIKDSQSRVDRENAQFEAAGNIITAHYSYEDRMAQAEKIESKDTRLGVMQIIKRQEDTRNYTETQAKKSKQLAVEDHIQTQINDLPPDQWESHQWMTPSQRNSFELYKQKAIAGVKPETKAGVFYSLTNAVKNDTQAFAKLDLMSYIGDLNESDLKGFMEDQATIRAGGTPKTVKFTTLTDKTLKRGFEGIGQADYMKENPDSYAKIHELVQKEMTVYEEDTGKMMTDVEQSEVMNSVMRGYVDREGWDTAYTIGDIKPERLNPLADYLRGSEQAINTENLVRARDQFIEYRSDYVKFFEDANITYDEEDLVSMFESDNYLRNIIVSEGKEITTRNRKSYYLDYTKNLAAIDSALQAKSMAINTANRMKLYTAGRR